MAMKLTDVQKEADNYIRSLNREIQKALQLGNTTVANNLVSHAKQMFSKELNYNASKNMIVERTGEVIPQIPRSKENLQKYAENKWIETSKEKLLVKSKKKEGFAKALKPAYSNTKQINKAKKQIKQRNMTKGKKGKITQAEIAKQIELNDRLASIFASYEKFMSGEGTPDIEQYEAWEQALEQARNASTSDEKAISDIEAFIKNIGMGENNGFEEIGEEPEDSDEWMLF